MTFETRPFIYKLNGETFEKSITVYPVETDSNKDSFNELNAHCRDIEDIVEDMYDAVNQGASLMSLEIEGEQYDIKGIWERAQSRSNEELKNASNVTYRATPLRILGTGAALVGTLAAFHYGCEGADAVSNYFHNLNWTNQIMGVEVDYGKYLAPGRALGELVLSLGLPTISAVAIAGLSFNGIQKHEKNVTERGFPEKEALQVKAALYHEISTQVGFIYNGYMD